MDLGHLPPLYIALSTHMVGIEEKEKGGENVYAGGGVGGEVNTSQLGPNFGRPTRVVFDAAPHSYNKCCSSLHQQSWPRLLLQHPR